MDPLSITTGIITLLAACSNASKTFDKIRKIREVPEVLYSLNNEISDLRLVLFEIHDHREELFKKEFSMLTVQEQRLLELCHTLIERTWTKVHESETLIRTRLLMSTRFKYKLNLALLSQEHQKLAKLQINIRDAKQTIYSLWGLLDVRRVPEIQVRLRDILVIGTDTQERLRDSTSKIEGKLDQLLRIQPLTRKSSTGPNSPSVRSGNCADSQRVDISVARLSCLESLERDWSKCPNKKILDPILRPVSEICSWVTRLHQYSATLSETAAAALTHM